MMKDIEDSAKEAASDDLPRLFQEALAILGKTANVSDLVDRVRRLDLGLPAEDEFAVLCTWLGRCELVHKLDQQQVPLSSKQQYQVPDLLARFHSQINPTPVLIEVKTKSEKKLSFRPKDLQKLQNYADLLGMPLLIAWRYRGLWVLFETRHLKRTHQNYAISFTDAIKENLLGVLAGDVMYVLEERAGYHITVRKERLVDTDVREDHSVQQWHTVIEEMYFTNGLGDRCNDPGEGVPMLFVTTEFEHVQKHTDTHIYLHATAGQQGLQPSHRALVELLRWESSKDQELNWRHVLLRDQPLATMNNFHALLEAGLRKSIVHIVLEQRPNTHPHFIAPPDPHSVGRSTD